MSLISETKIKDLALSILVGPVQFNDSQQSPGCCDTIQFAGMLV